jgi:hypothetical protein
VAHVFLPSPPVAPFQLRLPEHCLSTTSVCLSIGALLMRSEHRSLSTAPPRPRRDRRHNTFRHLGRTTPPPQLSVRPRAPPTGAPPRPHGTNSPFPVRSRRVVRLPQRLSAPFVYPEPPPKLLHSLPTGDQCRAALPSALLDRAGVGAGRGRARTVSAPPSPT